MAKGNNGNLLQHFIECELASLLTESEDSDHLHIILTHGMEPFEGLERPKNRLLSLLERVAELDPTEVQELGYPLLSAYKSLGACAENYPNTAEMLAQVLGCRTRLVGHVFENDQEKANELVKAWKGCGVKAVPDSWRGDPGKLMAPDDLDCPWLFSMDPYSYRSGERNVDDGYLYDSDLCRLRECFVSHLERKGPGAVSIFCYALETEAQEAYSEAIRKEKEALAMKTGGRVFSLSVDIAAGRRKSRKRKHVGALVSRDEKLLSDVQVRWERFLETQYP